jgi:hypothetical protein
MTAFLCAAETFVVFYACRQLSVHQCRTEGGFGGVRPLRTEIPKFWQSWAEFPVPWKIHLEQPNKQMGFTHLQIERNPWLWGYRPQIRVLSALCPQLNLLNPPHKIPGYATAVYSVFYSHNIPYFINFTPPQNNEHFAGIDFWGIHHSLYDGDSKIIAPSFQF